MGIKMKVGWRLSAMIVAIYAMTPRLFITWWVFWWACNLSLLVGIAVCAMCSSLLPKAGLGKSIRIVISISPTELSFIIQNFVLVESGQIWPIVAGCMPLPFKLRKLEAKELSLAIRPWKRSLFLNSDSLDLGLAIRHPNEWDEAAAKAGAVAAVRNEIESRLAALKENDIAIDPNPPQVSTVTKLIDAIINKVSLGSDKFFFTLESCQRNDEDGSAIPPAIIALKVQKLDLPVAVEFRGEAVARKLGRDIATTGLSIMVKPEGLHLDVHSAECVLMAPMDSVLKLATPPIIAGLLSAHRGSLRRIEVAVDVAGSSIINLKKPATGAVFGVLGYLSNASAWQGKFLDVEMRRGDQIHDVERGELVRQMREATTAKNSSVVIGKLQENLRYVDALVLRRWAAKDVDAFNFDLHDEGTWRTNAEEFWATATEVKAKIGKEQSLFHELAIKLHIGQSDLYVESAGSQVAVILSRGLGVSCDLLPATTEVHLAIKQYTEIKARSKKPGAEGLLTLITSSDTLIDEELPIGAPIFEVGLKMPASAPMDVRLVSTNSKILVDCPAILNTFLPELLGLLGSDTVEPAPETEALVAPVADTSTTPKAAGEVSPVSPAILGGMELDATVIADRSEIFLPSTLDRDIVTQYHNGLKRAPKGIIPKAASTLIELHSGKAGENLKFELRGAALDIRYGDQGVLLDEVAKPMDCVKIIYEMSLNGEEGAKTTVDVKFPFATMSISPKVIQHGKFAADVLMAGLSSESDPDIARQSSDPGGSNALGDSASRKKYLKKSSTSNLQEDESEKAKLTRRLRQLFDEVDIDRSGALDRAEVLSLMQRLCSTNENTLMQSELLSEFQSLWAVVDVSQDGTVSFEEFSQSVDSYCGGLGSEEGEANDMNGSLQLAAGDVCCMQGTYGEEITKLLKSQDYADYKASASYAVSQAGDVLTPTDMLRRIGVGVIRSKQSSIKDFCLKNGMELTGILQLPDLKKICSNLKAAISDADLEKMLQGEITKDSFFADVDRLNDEMIAIEERDFVPQRRSANSQQVETLADKLKEEIIRSKHHAHGDDDDTDTLQAQWTLLRMLQNWDVAKHWWDISVGPRLAHGAKWKVPEDSPYRRASEVVRDALTGHFQKRVTDDKLINDRLASNSVSALQRSAYGLSIKATGFDIGFSDVLSRLQGHQRLHIKAGSPTSEETAAFSLDLEYLHCPDGQLLSENDELQGNLSFNGFYATCMRNSKENFPKDFQDEELKWNEHLIEKWGVQAFVSCPMGDSTTTFNLVSDQHFTLNLTSNLMLAILPLMASLVPPERYRSKNRLTSMCTSPLDHYLRRRELPSTSKPYKDGSKEELGFLHLMVVFGDGGEQIGLAESDEKEMTCRADIVEDNVSRKKEYRVKQFVPMREVITRIRASHAHDWTVNKIAFDSDGNLQVVVKKKDPNSSSMSSPPDVQIFTRDRCMTRPANLQRERVRANQFNRQIVIFNLCRLPGCWGFYSASHDPISDGDLEIGGQTTIEAPLEGALRLDFDNRNSQYWPNFSTFGRQAYPLPDSFTEGSSMWGAIAKEAGDVQLCFCTDISVENGNPVLKLLPAVEIRNDTLHPVFIELLEPESNGLRSFEHYYLLPDDNFQVPLTAKTGWVVRTHGMVTHSFVLCPEIFRHKGKEKEEGAALRQSLGLSLEKKPLLGHRLPDGASNDVSRNNSFLPSNTSSVLRSNSILPRGTSFLPRGASFAPSRHLYRFTLCLLPGMRITNALPFPLICTLRHTEGEVDTNEQQRSLEDCLRHEMKPGAKVDFGLISSGFEIKYDLVEPAKALLHPGCLRASCKLPVPAGSINSEQSFKKWVATTKSLDSVQFNFHTAENEARTDERLTVSCSLQRAWTPRSFPEFTAHGEYIVFNKTGLPIKVKSSIMDLPFQSADQMTLVKPGDDHNLEVAVGNIKLLKPQEISKPESLSTEAMTYSSSTEFRCWDDVEHDFKWVQCNASIKKRSMAVQAQEAASSSTSPATPNADIVVDETEWMVVLSVPISDAEDKELKWKLSQFSTADIADYTTTTEANVLCLEDPAHSHKLLLKAASHDDACEWLGHLEDVIKELQINVHHTEIGIGDKSRQACVPIVAENQWSKPLPVKAPGEGEVSIDIVDGPNRAMLYLGISVEPMIGALQLSQAVTFAPRYIVQNRTSEFIQVLPAILPPEHFRIFTAFQKPITITPPAHTAMVKAIMQTRGAIADPEHFATFGTMTSELAEKYATWVPPGESAVLYHFPSASSEDPSQGRKAVSLRLSGPAPIEVIKASDGEPMHLEKVGPSFMPYNDAHLHIGFLPQALLGAAESGRLRCLVTAFNAENMLGDLILTVAADVFIAVKKDAYTPVFLDMDDWQKMPNSEHISMRDKRREAMDFRLFRRRFPPGRACFDGIGAGSMIFFLSSARGGSEDNLDQPSDLPWSEWFDLQSTRDDLRTLRPHDGIAGGHDVRIVNCSLQVMSSTAFLVISETAAPYKVQNWSPSRTLAIEFDGDSTRHVLPPLSWWSFVWPDSSAKNKRLHIQDVDSGRRQIYDIDSHGQQPQFLLSEIDHEHHRSDTAPLTEKGYYAIVALNDADEMAAFLKRLCHEINPDHRARMPSDATLKEFYLTVRSDQSSKTLEKVCNKLILERLVACPKQELTENGFQKAVVCTATMATFIAELVASGGLVAEGSNDVEKFAAQCRKDPDIFRVIDQLASKPWLHEEREAEDSYKAAVKKHNVLSVRLCLWRVALEDSKAQVSSYRKAVDKVAEEINHEMRGLHLHHGVRSWREAKLAVMKHKIESETADLYDRNRVHALPRIGEDDDQEVPTELQIEVLRIEDIVSIQYAVGNILKRATGNNSCRPKVSITCGEEEVETGSYNAPDGRRADIGEMLQLPLSGLEENVQLDIRVVHSSSVSFRDRALIGTARLSLAREELMMSQERNVILTRGETEQGRLVLRIGTLPNVQDFVELGSDPALSSSGNQGNVLPVESPLARGISSATSLMDRRESNADAFSDAGSTTNADDHGRRQMMNVANSVALDEEGYREIIGLKSDLALSVFVRRKLKAENKEVLIADLRKFCKKFRKREGVSELWGALSKELEDKAWIQEHIDMGVARLLVYRSQDAMTKVLSFTDGVPSTKNNGNDEQFESRNRHFRDWQQEQGILVPGAGIPLANLDIDVQFAGLHVCFLFDPDVHASGTMKTYSDQRREEIFILTVDHFRFLKKAEEERMQMTLHNFQIDNMRHADKGHPIILAPLNSGFQIHRREKPSRPRVDEEGNEGRHRELTPFLLLEMELAPSEVLHVETFNFLLQPVQIRIDAQFWMNVAGQILDWSGTWSTSGSTAVEDHTAAYLGELHESIDAPTSNSNDTFLILEEFHIGAIVSHLEFLMPPKASGSSIDEAGDEYADAQVANTSPLQMLAWSPKSIKAGPLKLLSVPLMAMQKALGVVMKSVGSGVLSGVGHITPKVVLSDLAYAREIGAMTIIRNKIIRHYVKAGASQAYKFLFSTNILGDPIGLGASLGGGVMQFLRKSKDELETGQLKGEGVKDLVDGVVGGAAGFTGKFIGAVGDTIDAVAQQDNTAHNEEVRHLGHGVVAGVKTVGKGVVHGIQGLVVKPVEGFKKEGMGGLGKGLIQGTVGVLAKPASGILHGAQYLAEGLEAQTHLLTKQEDIRPRRGPRALSKQEAFLPLTGLELLPKISVFIERLELECVADCQGNVYSIELDYGYPKTSKLGSVKRSGVVFRENHWIPMDKFFEPGNTGLALSVKDRTLQDHRAGIDPSELYITASNSAARAYACYDEQHIQGCEAEGVVTDKAKLREVIISCVQHLILHPDIRNIRSRWRPAEPVRLLLWPTEAMNRIRQGSKPLELKLRFYPGWDPEAIPHNLRYVEPQEYEDERIRHANEEAQQSETKPPPEKAVGFLDKKTKGGLNIWSNKWVVLENGMFKYWDDKRNFDRKDEPKVNFCLRHPAGAKKPDGYCFAFGPDRDTCFLQVSRRQGEVQAFWRIPSTGRVDRHHLQTINQWMKAIYEHTAP